MQITLGQQHNVGEKPTIYYYLSFFVFSAQIPLTDGGVNAWNVQRFCLDNYILTIVAQILHENIQVTRTMYCMYVCIYTIRPCMYVYVCIFIY